MAEHTVHCVIQSWALTMEKVSDTDTGEGKLSIDEGKHSTVLTKVNTVLTTVNLVQTKANSVQMKVNTVLTVQD